MKMLNCITRKLHEETGISMQEAAEAYELCKSYALAKEYMRLISAAVARYVLKDGKKTPYGKDDYLCLAKININKNSEKKLIHFTEVDVNGGGENAELWVNVGCNIDSIKECTAVLSEVIDEMKSIIPAEEWDTDGVVKLACEHVFGRYADFEVLLPDMDITF